MWRVSVLLLLSWGLHGGAEEADWPVYQHDYTRSGVTRERLAFPLNPVWTHQVRQPPQPAWPAPAPRDIWHEIRELNPLLTYDRAFHPVVVGQTVYFGSSADDAVHALDAATGRERWVFHTEGPVRLAPAVDRDRLFVGSDDGCVYCLDARDGTLRWKRAVEPRPRLLPGNGRLISSVPVRGGVVVEGDRVYAFAGLFPEEAVYLCALGVDDGRVIWRQQLREVSPQGYPLASPTRLLAPTGRTAPAMFQKDTGAPLGALGGAGGTYALLCDDLLLSQTDREGRLGLSDPATRERIATFDGLHVIVQGTTAYLHTRTEISAFDRVRHTELARQHTRAEKRLQDLRKSRRAPATEAARSERERELAAAQAEVKKLERGMAACFSWHAPCANPYQFILAGDTLFAGGDDQVVALASANGQALWTGKVRGRAYGLAVAQGRLWVSTDQGAIHCFGPSGSPAAEIASSMTPEPFGVDEFTPFYHQAAEAILTQSGVREGYCLVLGAEQGRLAYELARRSELRVVAVEDDPRKAAAARLALAKSGMYGQRVSVHESALDALPYGTYLFNLVVSDRFLRTGEVPTPAAEVMRLLRPQGGVACLGRPSGPGADTARDPLGRWLRTDAQYATRWQTTNGTWVMVRREPVPGGGEWVQLYANSSHTACSGDVLRGPMAIQWFGDPGPRRIVDRHHRPMSSLFKSGRVFIPGDDIVFAVDAYNGAPLWQREIPRMRRVGALKDSGQMVVADDLLYVARQNECWLLPVESGEKRSVLAAPQLEPGRTNDWGYLDQVGDRLLGTAQAAGASFNLLHLDMVNTIEGDFRPVIVSRYLFCLDRHTGAVLWTHRGGTLMNNAIAVGDGRVYFVESRNPAALTNATGRMGIREFCADATFLLAVDLQSGKKLFEQPVRLPYEHIMFLNYAQDTILLTGTFNQQEQVHYGLFAFQGASGRPQWENRYRAMDSGGTGPAATDGSHGEQWQHPVIVGDRVYSRPYDFDLRTGTKGTKRILRGGGGCGGWTASLNYLFGRGSNPRSYDLSLDATSGDPLTTVSRPGCWLNIIPAGGLVVVPESSSGCTCAYPIQTSLALAPRSVQPAR